MVDKYGIKVYNKSVKETCGCSHLRDLDFNPCEDYPGQIIVVPCAYGEDTVIYCDKD